MTDWRGLLVQAHALAAWRTDIPEIAIDEEHAGRVVDAVARVMRHYPVTVSEKAADFSFLLTTALIVYGPIIFLIYQKKKWRDNPDKEETVRENNVAKFPAE